MYTRVTTEKGDIVFTTQQYVVGLYVVITMGSNSDQGSSRLKEEAYHKKIRKQADANGHTWIGSEMAERPKKYPND